MTSELLTTINTDTDSEEEYLIDKTGPLQSKFIMSIHEAQQPEADSAKDISIQAIIDVWQSWLLKYARWLVTLTPPTLCDSGVTVLEDVASNKYYLRYYGIEHERYWVLREDSREYIRAEIVANSTLYRFFCSDIRYGKWTSMPLIHNKRLMAQELEKLYEG